MEKEFVNRFLIENGKYFPTRKLNKIGVLLESSNVSEYVINRKYYNPLTIMVVMFFLFGLGLMLFLDRLFLRDWFWGWLKLISPFLLGALIYINRDVIYLADNPVKFILIACTSILLLWVIVDIFTLYNRIKESNYRKLLVILKTNYSSEKVFSNSKTLRNENQNIDFEIWRQNNPSLSINEYYKLNRRNT